ncbi:MAG: Zn-ribbon domain-containing OB-fold protein [Candidatus Hodarchaeota archaeon]
MSGDFQDHQIRDIIKINYKYSMGGQSKFFLEVMNNKKLLGTKCTKCGKTWMPPRINCSDCYAPADWVELNQTGTIEVSTIVWYTASAFIKAVPYGIGFIKLDGAETALLQGIFSENLVPSKIKNGKKVRAVFNKEREGKMTDFFFVPEDEYEKWINKPEFEGGK